jgi:excisionase family DNA binding protein
MSENFYTVEAAAKRLHLHPKTVLRLIREQRLRGTRIGKSYRILGSDLEAFAGAPASEPRAAEPARVTAIADIPDLTRAEADRLLTPLHAVLMASRSGGEPIRLETAYDPDTRRLKAVIIAAPADAAAMLQMLSTVLEAVR